MTTLAQLTRRVARLLGRTVIGQATALGTATTLIDTTNLANFPDDQFNNGTVWITSGTYGGLSRAITDFVQSTKTLTFATLAGAVAKDVTYEVADSNLVTYQDLRQAVNLALQEVGPIMDEPDETLTVVDGQFVYDLPTGIERVVVIEAVDNPGDDDETAYPCNHWIEKQGQIVFDQNGLPSAGQTLRLYPAVFHADLAADTDTMSSDLDEDYIVHLAARQALRIAYKRYGKEREEIPEWLNEAVAEAQARKTRHVPFIRVHTA